jgi:hypothetical protein
MSDYEDYDYGEGDAARPKQLGLSKEVVDLIYWQVLGVGDAPPPAAMPASNPEPAKTPPQNRGWFQPGQSGNPKGRTRKQFSVAPTPATGLDQDLLATLAKESLARMLMVNRDGVKDQRSVHEILIEHQVLKAAKGSTAAARLIDALQQRANKAEATKRAQEYAAWKDRKTRYAATHAKSAKHGVVLDWSCPHPDDIVLGPGHEVRVDGPMTPEALAETRRLYEQRPYWLMLATYESWLQLRRQRRRPGCPHVHARLVSSHVFEAIQRQLPPRLRMTSAQIAGQVADWQRLAGRALHERLRAEAARTGLPVPPRALRIPFTLANPHADALIPDVSAPGNDALRCAPADQSIPGLLRTAWVELMAQQVREG